MYQLYELFCNSSSPFISSGMLISTGYILNTLLFRTKISFVTHDLSCLVSMAFHAQILSDAGSGTTFNPRADMGTPFKGIYMRCLAEFLGFMPQTQAYARARAEIKSFILINAESASLHSVQTQAGPTQGFYGGAWYNLASGQIYTGVTHMSATNLLIAACQK